MLISIQRPLDCSAHERLTHPTVPGSLSRGDQSSFILQSFLNDPNDPAISRRVAENSTIPATRVVRAASLHYQPTTTSILQNGTSLNGSQSYHGSLAGMTLGSSSRDTASVSTSIGVRETVPRVLDADEHGVLEARAFTGPVTYDCPFDHLNCHRAFADFDAWYAHSLTHFKGMSPPKVNQCPFCSMPFNTRTGEQSWKVRMEHVANHHRNGYRLNRTGRFDPELYRYLWNQRIIDDIDYKHVTGGRVPSAAEEVYPSPPTSPSTNSSAYTEDHRRRFQRPSRRG